MRLAGYWLVLLDAEGGCLYHSCERQSVSHLTSLISSRAVCRPTACSFPTIAQ